MVEAGRAQEKAQYQVISCHEARYSRERMVERKRIINIRGAGDGSQRCSSVRRAAPQRVMPSREIVEREAFVSADVMRRALSTRD